MKVIHERFVHTKFDIYVLIYKDISFCLSKSHTGFIIFIIIFLTATFWKRKYLINFLIHIWSYI